MTTQPTTTAGRALPTTTGALWDAPDISTPEGQRLFGLFRDGRLAGNHASGIRDFGQRITQIENEAADAALAGLAEKVRFLRITPNDYLTEYGHGYEDGVNAVLALLESVR